MLYSFHHPATRALFTLTNGAPVAEQHYRPGTPPFLLTIAWNRGPAQTLWVDELPMVVPTNAIVTMVTSQQYRFERATDVVLWRFNREFYCIVDHDQDVACVGLLFFGSQGTNVLPLVADDVRRLTALLTVFEDELQTADAIQGEMLRALLKRLIIMLTRLARDSAIGDALTQPQLDVVRRFNLLVENNYRTLHRVSDYASLMNKAPKTLANLFAAHNERTPLQVIQERIAVEAKRMLLYTDKSVKQIASDLGFADASTFSRFFKSVTETSPQDFRTDDSLATAQ